MNWINKVDAVTGKTKCQLTQSETDFPQGFTKALAPMRGNQHDLVIAGQTSQRTGRPIVRTGRNFHQRIDNGIPGHANTLFWNTLLHEDLTSVLGRREM